MLIKSKFTRVCDDQFKGTLSTSRQEKREQNIWQRRFWEHQIRDEMDYKRHVDYVHKKHTQVDDPRSLGQQKAIYL
jgi:putative transposase